MIAPNRRTGNGFTLLELMVVVVIVGVLTACSYPNFIGAQKKAKLVQVKDNMHTCQLASESYATDTSGIYAPGAADLASYYPGGANNLGGAAGNFPSNPFTGSADTPGGCSLTNVAAARLQPPGSITGSPGNVQYGCIVDSNGAASAYAIIGMDDAGKSLAGNANHQLVLSNQ
jgi:prepilin-type N-terminal cleavage/methylation domain-containing protein